MLCVLVFEVTSSVVRFHQYVDSKLDVVFCQLGIVVQKAPVYERRPKVINSMKANTLSVQRALNGADELHGIVGSLTVWRFRNATINAYDVAVAGSHSVAFCVHVGSLRGQRLQISYTKTISEKNLRTPKYRKINLMRWNKSVAEYVLLQLVWHVILSQRHSSNTR